MVRAEAIDHTIKKYEKGKIDKVLVRFPKGAKSECQKHAKSSVLSLNACLYRAALETMYRDKHPRERFILIPNIIRHNQLKLFRQILQNVFIQAYSVCFI